MFNSDSINTIEVHQKTIKKQKKKYYLLKDL